MADNEETPATVPIKEQRDADADAVSQGSPTTAFRYIRVWLIVGGMAGYIFLARYYFSPNTTLRVHILLGALLTTSVSFFLGNALYSRHHSSQVKLDDPADTVPWTHRHIINSLVSNSAATFIAQGTLSPADIFSGFILAQLGSTLQDYTDGYLGRTAAPPGSSRRRLVNAVKLLAACSAAYMLVPHTLEPLVMYGVRVYLRATFNATVDVSIGTLTAPIPGFRRTASTLLFLLLATFLSIRLLLNTDFFAATDAAGCPQRLYSLVYTDACLAQVHPAHPRALHRTTACLDEYGLDAAALRDRLAEKADEIARRCTPADHGRAWAQACIVARGDDRGHQFGRGRSLGLIPAMNLFRECATEFGLGGAVDRLTVEAMAQLAKGKVL